MKHLLITAIALTGIWWPAAPAHSIAPDDFLRLDGQQLVVPRALLGVPLLLIPTLVEGTFAIEPRTWNTVWTIHFQQIETDLQLVADPVGTSANATERAPIILATFPIRTQSDSKLTVDFHSIVLDTLLREWMDFTSAALEANAILLGGSAGAEHSDYVRSSASGPGWFTMEQVLAVHVNRQNHGAVVRWTFRREDASTLEPLLDDQEDQWGFFSHPRFTPGNTTPQHIVHRFDPARPVTFYLSANMPLHVRPYMRDAVLSWNTVLERPFLQVADAPPGVTPGDPRYSLIQWVENDDGRSAYGMAIAHPRTGEVLTALITIPSGFAQPSRALQDIPAHSADPAPLADGVLCAYRAEPWHTDDLLADGNGLDLRELGLRQLQAVVIHEVGHVLGLRHNFAASLDGDATLPASSAMDYLSPADNIRMLAPGDYDRAAVVHLYNRAPLPQDAPLHFCTDYHLGTVADCAHWDGGAEPIRWHAEQIEGAAQAVSRWIPDNMIVPADLLDTMPRDWSFPNAQVGRLTVSWKALQHYRTGSAWTLHGLFPYERAAMAQAALAQFLANFDPDDVLHTHPLIREPLASHITTLETQAARDDATGRWATQVLRNIVDRLQYALSLS